MHSGKNKFCDSYHKVTETRKIFHRALKFCKWKKQQIKEDKMAEGFVSKNSKGFLKKVNFRGGRKPAIAENLDVLTKKEDISELFARKFSGINGSTKGSSPPAYAGGGGFIACFLNGDVRVAISRLKKGIGLDGVHSNLFKYLNDLTITYFKRFFNSCIVHSFLPQSILNGSIQPRINNRFGDP